MWAASVQSCATLRLTGALKQSLHAVIVQSSFTKSMRASRCTIWLKNILEISLTWALRQNHHLFHRVKHRSQTQELSSCMRTAMECYTWARMIIYADCRSRGWSSRCRSVRRFSTQQTTRLSSYLSSQTWTISTLAKSPAMSLVLFQDRRWGHKPFTHYKRKRLQTVRHYLRLQNFQKDLSTLSDMVKAFRSKESGYWSALHSSIQKRRFHRADVC